MNTVTPASLENDLTKGTLALLEIARTSEWNPLSNNCLYIVSEIRNDGSLWEQRQRRLIENRRKRPQPLAHVMPELLRRFDDLHDINLFIHKAERERSIVDIRYFPKASLPTEVQDRADSRGPMLHAKLSVPPWLFDKTEGFDVHWEHHPWMIRWRMFWARQQFKKKL